jgi:hypothetical protein
MNNSSFIIIPVHNRTFTPSTKDDFRRVSRKAVSCGCNLRKLVAAKKDSNLLQKIEGTLPQIEID